MAFTASVWSILLCRLTFYTQISLSSIPCQVDGMRVATPLLLVLICIELSDVVFAVDSVPAVFGVTKVRTVLGLCMYMYSQTPPAQHRPKPQPNASQDPFVVYTSNIFAILGLRSLYTVLANAVVDLPYLKPGKWRAGKGLIDPCVSVDSGGDTVHDRLASSDNQPHPLSPINKQLDQPKQRWRPSWASSASSSGSSTSATACPTSSPSGSSLRSSAWAWAPACTTNPTRTNDEDRRRGGGWECGARVWVVSWWVMGRRAVVAFSSASGGVGNGLD